MFAQWKPCPYLPPRPYPSANITESSSRHLQLIIPWPTAQSVRSKHATLPPLRTGVTSPLWSRLCRQIKLQDGVLQPQLLFRDEDKDMVVELALGTELPQNGLRLRRHG
jgi:hypothetical protein